MTHPSYCCPKCGDPIGWTGRFFQFIRIPLHRCEETKKPYKVKVRIDNSGASEWVNIGEYFLSDEGREFLKEMSEFAKRNIKKMTKIEIGSKWKHKTSNDVYVVMEQYSHRVVLEHEPTGKTIKLTIGHLNPQGFDEYRPL